MKIIRKIQTVAMLSLLILFSNCAIADYQTILKNANQAIDSLGIGKHDVELTYRNGGILILEGSVASETARQQVDQAVSSVDGVNQLDNRLVVIPDKSNMVMMPVRPPTIPNDQDIGRAIKQALSTSDGFDNTQLEYKVDNRRVVLMGQQESFQAIDKILSVVLMVDGVADVNSEMTVKGQQYPSFKR